MNSQRNELGQFLGLPSSRPGFRVCRDCGNEKPNSEFWRKGIYLQSYCKECQTARNEQWATENPERRSIGKRTASRRRVHKMSREEMDTLLQGHEGTCDLCATTEPGGRWKVFVIDHCHRTGKRRGLLCDRCNRGLALWNDDPIRLRKAIEYLERAESK